MLPFRARSHASADPCQNGLQAGSCIIFFACPGSKWRLSLSLSLSLKEHGQISLHHGKSLPIPPFFVFFNKSSLQQHLPNLASLPLVLLFSTLLQPETKRSITAFAEQHKLGRIAHINHKCVHWCNRQLYRPEPENNRSSTVLFEALAARMGVSRGMGGAVLNSGAGKTSCSLNRHKQD